MNTNNSNTGKHKFGVTPSEDYLWCASQSPCVQKVWLTAWAIDPFGDRWVPIEVDVPESTFRKARSVITNADMFDFKPDKSAKDKRKTSIWLVRNLRGSKSHLYREINSTIKEKNKLPAHELAIDAHSLADSAHELAGNLPQTLTPQASCNPSLDYSVSNTINKQEKLNQPIENKYVDLEIPTDPVIGTNSYKVEKNPPASSLINGMMPTLDATASTELVEESLDNADLAEQESNLNGAVTLDATPLENEKILKERITLTIHTGLGQEEIITLEVNEAQYREIMMRRLVMPKNDFEEYKISLLHSDPSSIVSREPSRTASNAYEYA